MTSWSKPLRASDLFEVEVVRCLGDVLRGLKVLVKEIFSVRNRILCSITLSEILLPQEIDWA